MNGWDSIVHIHTYEEKFEPKVGKIIDKSYFYDDICYIFIENLPLCSTDELMENFGKYGSVLHIIICQRQNTVSFPSPLYGYVGFSSLSEAIYAIRQKKYIKSTPIKSYLAG